VARVVPRFAAQIESWLARWLPLPTSLSAQEIRSEIVAPLLEQIRLDVGEFGTQVAMVRLDPAETNVQQTAHQLRTTRSRIYETASETASALAVRWPEGQTLLKKFNLELVAGSADRELLELVDSVSRLFSPIARSGVDEALVEEAPRTRDPRVDSDAPLRGHSGAVNRNGRLTAGRL